MNIGFDRHWNQSTIRNLVRNNCYLEFGKHEDLRAVCINEEDILSDTRDWNELTFIVPTEWLRAFCKERFEEDDLDYFLKEVYTSDESQLPRPTANALEVGACNCPVV